MFSRGLSGKHELCQRNCIERVLLLEFVKREFIDQYFGAERRKTEQSSMDLPMSLNRQRAGFPRIP